jgi:hypothetical protein
MVDVVARISGTIVPPLALTQCLPARMPREIRCPVHKLDAAALHTIAGVPDDSRNRKTTWRCAAL